MNPKTIKTLRYLLSVFIIFIGLAVIGQSIGTTVFYVLTGILMLPQVNELVKAKVAFLKGTWSRVGLYVVLWVIGTSFVERTESFQADRAKRKVESIQAYLDSSEVWISKLDPANKKKRDSIIALLQEDSVYVILVKRQVVSEDYLEVLQDIGVIMSRVELDGSSSLPDNLVETHLKPYPEKETFLLRCFSLSSKGGLPIEILEVYLSYRQTYGLYNAPGNNKYSTSGIKLTSKGFTLAPAFAIFEGPQYETLVALYNAMADKVLSWRGLDDETNVQDYKFPYLVDKEAFFDRVYANFRDSELMDKGYKLTFGYAGVKLVDGKYRYFFNVQNRSKYDFTGSMKQYMIWANKEEFMAYTIDDMTIRGDGAASFYVDYKSAPYPVQVANYGYNTVEAGWGVIQFRFEVKRKGRVVTNLLRDMEGNLERVQE